MLILPNGTEQLSAPGIGVTGVPVLPDSKPRHHNNPSKEHRKGRGRQFSSSHSILATDVPQIEKVESIYYPTVALSNWSNASVGPNAENEITTCKPHRSAGPAFLPCQGQTNHYEGFFLQNLGFK